MGWRDTIRDSKSSWRDTIREAKEPAAEIPEMESASKGFFDTASFGLDDEFAGGLEAIGRVAGVQGFGAPNFSDAKFAQPEGFSNFGANYEKARDARRLAKMNAEEANSKSYFGGQVAGGFVTPASRSISSNPLANIFDFVFYRSHTVNHPSPSFTESPLGVSRNLPTISLRAS